MEWCGHRLGSPVTTVLFEVSQLSRVLALRLVDGREVVIKARPWEDRVLACSIVEQSLADQGFPAPRPLMTPEKFRGHVVSAEEYRPGGQPLSDSPDSALLVAGLLARLVALTPVVSGVDALIGSSPPWVGWDHPGAALWPARDTPGPPLVAGTGPAWIDKVGAAVREALTGLEFPLVLGHGDWEAHNLSWSERRPYAVHDWDSLKSRPNTLS
jgi:hypothetical protein